MRSNFIAFRAGIDLMVPIDRSLGGNAVGGRLTWVWRSIQRSRSHSVQQERRQLDLAFPGVRLEVQASRKSSLGAGEDVAILRSHLTQRAATPQGFLRPIIVVLAPDSPLGIPASPRPAGSGTRTSPW